MTGRISHADPADWQGLQEEVRVLFSECGFEAKCEQEVALVRGSAEVDVYAIDRAHDPTLVYIVECKHWAKPVPQHVVHAFRTVVSDHGAHVGFIVSKEGYQSGAHSAVERSNVTLLTLEELEQRFLRRWWVSYFVPTLQRDLEPFLAFGLSDEEMLDRALWRAGIEGQRNQSIKMSYDESVPVAFFVLACISGSNAAFYQSGRLELPLRRHSPETALVRALPSPILDSTSYREVLTLLVAHGVRLIKEVEGCAGVPLSQLLVG